MFVVHKGVEIAGEYFTPGMIIQAVPAEAEAWLIECGAIEPVEGEADKPAPKRKGGK